MASHSGPYGPGGESAPRVPSPEDQAPYGRPPQPARPDQPASHPGHQAHPGPHDPSAQPWPEQGPAVPAGEPRRPSSITASFWLIVVSGVLMALTTALGSLAAQTPEGETMVREQARASLESTGGGGLSEAEVEQYLDAVIPAMRIGMLIMAVVLLGCFLLVAFGVRRGSRAARTTGAVLSAISVLMILGSLLMGQISPLDLLWVGLGVAGVVMAFRPDATEFMRQKAWQKFQRRHPGAWGQPQPGSQAGPPR